MKRLLIYSASLLAGLFLAVSCGSKEEPEQGGDKPGPEPIVEPTNEPSAEQIETLSTFIMLAMADDDYCSKLTSTEESFSVETFKGRKCDIGAKIPVVAENASTEGLKNFVIDGQRFAEFHLGSETLSIPSDIHQWYNPPIPKNIESLKVLSFGTSFCEDATALLPGMLAAGEITSVKLGRAVKDGATLADWKANFTADNWCSYSAWDSTLPDWPVLFGANSSAEAALKADTWDVITIMEDSTVPAGWSFDQGAKENLNAILDMIFPACTTKRPTVLLMLAPALPSAHETVVANFNGDGMKMFDALVAYGKAVTDQTCIFDIVSVCAGQQNLRTSSLSYTSKNGLTRDGVHLDSGVGCYTAAGVFFCKLVEPAIGAKFAENTYSYEFSSTEEGQVSTPVDAVNLPLCRYAASNAATFPLQLTDLSSLTPSINGSDIPGAKDNPYSETL